MECWSFCFFFFFSSRRRHTRLTCDWSSDCALPILDDARLVDQQTASGRSAISAAGKTVQNIFRAGGDGHAESRSPVARAAGQGRSVKGTAVQNQIEIGRASCRERGEIGEGDESVRE